MYITINDIIGEKTIDLIQLSVGMGPQWDPTWQRGPVGLGSHSDPKSQSLA